MSAIGNMIQEYHNRKENLLDKGERIHNQIQSLEHASNCIKTALSYLSKLELTTRDAEQAAKEHAKNALQHLQTI